MRTSKTLHESELCKIEVSEENGLQRYHVTEFAGPLHEELVTLNEEDAVAMARGILHFFLYPEVPYVARTKQRPAAC